MKKFIALATSACLALGSTLCMAAPKEVEYSFALERIEHHLGPQMPLKFSFGVPNTIEGGCLMAALYYNGTLQKLIPLDVSQTTDTTADVTVTYKDDDGLPLTPDEVRLFVWNKDNLKPLTVSSQNLLTSEVIEKANYNTLQNILRPLLGINAVNVIDKLKAEIDLPSTVPDVMSLLSYIEIYAQTAYDNRATVLLTCESTKRLLGEDFTTLKTLSEKVQADKAQQGVLSDAYMALTAKQKEKIEYMFKFFNLPLPVPKSQN